MRIAGAILAGDQASRMGFVREGLWEQLDAQKAVFDNPRALCNINTPRDFEFWKKEIG